MRWFPIRVILVGGLMVGPGGGVFARAGDQPAAASRIPPAAETPVDFARDIQPLLAKRCHACHGPEKTEGSLRLDRKEDAFRGGASGLAIEPGRSSESRLIHYVSGLNEDEIIMPPEGERLTEAEIGLLGAWIDQGADWPDHPGAAERHAEHWSFRSVERPEIPRVTHTGSVRNAIDAFVLARLEPLGWAPSPEADRPTLIRRLAIDLVGLPPTPAEVDAFSNDARPDAYERLVKRLLASPQYGERWSRRWLDLARYADSDGYEKDTGRPHAWRWRNWVIGALNRDLPFDQFTIQQLAGDLLPGPPPEAQVATGLHRNTLTNREGGVDQEEFRVAATVDRVNTTGTIWLGLTVGCAQCHTHKYDPLAQREYYGLFAFFNSVEEVDVPAPLADQLAAYEPAKQAFDAAHVPLVAAVERYERETLPQRQAEWEQGLDIGSLTTWTVLEPLSATSAGGATLARQPDNSLLASGASPATDTYTIVAKSHVKLITAVRLEVMADPSLPVQGPGRVAHGNFVLSELRLAASPADAGGEPAPVALVNPSADFSQEKWPVGDCLDGDTKTGWAVAPEFGRNHVAVFETSQMPGFEGGTELAITLDQQYGQEHTIGRLRLAVTASERPVDPKGIPDEVAGILKVPAGARTADQQTALAKFYGSLDPDLAKLNQAVAEHAQQAPVDPGAATKAQALAELSQPRPTHILIRGDFLRPGDEVQAHTPAVLHPFHPRGARPDRLDLAMWLFDPANPLTARVTVNRAWQHFFGRGLAATENDFGTQGEPPTHPELLDWLAGELIARGWSMKALHELIVTSATYRQSSRVRDELVQRDPYNALLARQQRLRVEAEVVRDLALAASGLLNRTIGGPSVRPPQPVGIDELTYSGSAKWVASTGPDRYRRGMYTWFQRTSPYPMLMTFDAPDSNVACTRRERSNTPLQALVLLNDPAFFECAQALARRAVNETQRTGNTTLDASERLRHAFRLCLARQPADDELADLGQLYAAGLASYETNPEAAALLVGTQPLPDGVSMSELAALAVAGRTLLNLDEFITRE